MSELEIIEEIHAAFDNADEVVLQAAIHKMAKEPVEPELIVARPALVEKAKRLERLGFIRSPEVRHVEEITRANAENFAAYEKHVHFFNEAKQEAEDVAYYRQRYPFAKFLTMQALNSICMKYGLIYGPVDAFTADIPMKNLLEIENAQPLLATDCPDGFFTKKRDFSMLWSLPEPMVPKVALAALGMPGWSTLNEAIDFIHAPYVKPDKEQIVEDNRRQRNQMFGDLVVINGRARHIRSSDPLNGMWAGLYEGASIRSKQYQGNIDCPEREQFYIAAPFTSFDTSRLEQKSEFEYGFPVPAAEDPIVFRKVRGGILVISKWGTEASDPLLLNPADN